jgi:hypothetical protein
MKKKHVINGPLFVFLILFPGFMILSGCQSNPPSVSAPQGADRAEIFAYTVERTVPLYVDDPANKMRLFLRIPDVAREEGDPLKGLLWDLFYEGRRPEEYAGEILGVFRQQYEGVKEAVERNPDYPMGSLSWYYTEDFQIPLVNPALIVLRRTIEFYTGGAHGMNTCRWYVIDRVRTERLRLDSLFKAESRMGLERALAAALRVKAGIGTEEKLTGAGYFEDSPGIPDNFFLSPQGVGFHWDPYEIAPYSFGPIEVVLPYGEIRPFLNPRGLELITSL